MPPKLKQLYAETYKLHAAKIKATLLPLLAHVPPAFGVHSAYLMKAGKVELDGEPLEFQDIRVYLKERS